MDLGSGHPLAHLSRWLGDAEARMELSAYKYVPDSGSDERRILRAPCGPMGESWALDAIARLAPGEELAVHSGVEIGGRSMHIPMLDMACPALGSAQVGRLAKFLDPELFHGLRFYSTGRSYHAYGSRLLSPSELVHFLGSALLANEPGEPPVVDARWVGHRLRAGYCSLRLSANAERSLALPSLVGPSGD